MDNDTEDRNVGLPLVGTNEEREKLRLAIDTAYQESLMKDQAKGEKKEKEAREKEEHSIQVVRHQQDDHQRAIQLMNVRRQRVICYQNLIWNLNHAMLFQFGIRI